MKVLTVRLPDRLHFALWRYRKSSGVPINTAVRRAIETAYGTTPTPKPGRCEARRRAS